MKRLSITALAATIFLCGCAAQSTDKDSARHEAADQGEYTVGTLFPQKNKKRTDDTAASPATMNIDTVNSR